MKHSFRRYHHLALAMLITLLSFTLWMGNFSTIRQFEGKALNWAYALRGDIAWINPPVVLVTIDNESIQTFGHWPWGRNQIAQLGHAILEQQHAKTVALDMVFPEIETPLPAPLQTWIRTHPRTLPITLQDLINHDDLQSIMANNPHVVQGFFF